MSDEIDRLMESMRFEQAWTAATPAVQRWCEHFRHGGARSPQPTLDELAGQVLSWQAPVPDPAPDDGAIEEN